tara:strand:+ start:392 stop:745 length:354 start_codon:yes stop_codon:yes gene_type:complete
MENAGIALLWLEMQDSEKELDVFKRALDACKSKDSEYFEDLVFPDAWVTFFRYAPAVNPKFCETVYKCEFMINFVVCVRVKCSFMPLACQRDDIPEGQELQTVIFAVSVVCIFYSLK